MPTRRQFLENVGQGMLIASLGSSLAESLGASRAWADEETRLQFGAIEPIVDLLESTAPDRLVAAMVERLRAGTTLEQWIAAGALANARVFGGEDYIGFHAMMALTPAYRIARTLPQEQQPLPIFKVLYRSSARIAAVGGEKSETLHPIHASGPATPESTKAMVAAVRASDPAAAEQAFVAFADQGPDALFNQLLTIVEENQEVHRVMLPFRAWTLLEFTGKEQAHTLLRQSVRYCVKNEKSNSGVVRGLLPKLLDQHKLAGKTLGTRTLDDGDVAKLSEQILKAGGTGGADVAAGALADGIAPQSVFDAIARSANELTLRDRGRLAKWAQPNKPEGSVHGDSPGVHASDATNAWRNIARVCQPQHLAPAVLLAAYDVARARESMGEQFIESPRPWADHAKELPSDPQALLRRMQEAIREKNQQLACAAAERIGELGQSPEPMVEVLRQCAVEEDGALHGEKYFQTVSEEVALARAPHRWRQWIALARVSASASGQKAPGLDEARDRLGVLKNA